MVCSVEQAGEQLGCSRRKVFQLLRMGVLERAPRYGKQIRIYKDTVDRAQARPEGKAARKPRLAVAPAFDRSAVKW